MLFECSEMLRSASDGNVLILSACCVGAPRHINLLLGLLFNLHLGVLASQEWRLPLTCQS